VNPEDIKVLLEKSTIGATLERYRLFEWGQPYRQFPGAQNLHIVAVTIVEDTILTQVNEHGVMEREVPNDGRRGSQVCITYVDENDTMFYEVRAFHKGEVFCQLSKFSAGVDDGNPMDDDYEPAEPLHLEMGELWRN